MCISFPTHKQSPPPSPAGEEKKWDTHTKKIYGVVKKKMAHSRKEVIRPHIWLDLDQTLISSVSPSEQTKDLVRRQDRFAWKNMDKSYQVFARPHLQTFLSYIFRHFDVSVWTAASKNYALFIVDHFIRKRNPQDKHRRKDRPLKYILFSYHCKQSEKLTGRSKSLSLLTEKYRLPGVSKESTFIVDDSPEVYRTQPQKCLRVDPFVATARESHLDQFLINTLIPRMRRKLFSRGGK